MNQKLKRFVNTHQDILLLLVLGSLMLLGILNYTIYKYFAGFTTFVIILFLRRRKQLKDDYEADRSTFMELMVLLILLLFVLAIGEMKNSTKVLIYVVVLGIYFAGKYISGKISKMKIKKQGA